MSKELFDRASARKFSREELLRIVREAAEPVTASFGLEVWGIELTGAGRPVIRIYVDVPPSAMNFSKDDTPLLSEHPAGTAAQQASAVKTPAKDDASFLQDGVGIEQCAEISRLVGLALDVEEIFSDAWTLEISSPGMDRPFFRSSQLIPYVGQELDVTLWNAHPAYAPRKKFRGTLVRAGENDFVLHVEDMAPPERQADIVMIWDGVRRARLVPVFPDTSKPGKPSAPCAPKGTAAKKSSGGGKKA